MNVFYFNFFKIKGSYTSFCKIYNACTGLGKKNLPENQNNDDIDDGNKGNIGDWEKNDFGGCILMNGFSFEFGLNIIGLCDWIKKK